MIPHTCSNCGTTRLVYPSEARLKKTSLCRRCFFHVRNTTHGVSNTKLYRILKNVMTRCYNPRSRAYKNYGGRGIPVAEEWRQNRESFVVWALAHGYKDNLTLDRIDNDAGYTPDNCRFVDRSTQRHNSRCLSAVNTSGYRGVSKHQSGKWQTYLKHKGVVVYIGQFLCRHQAAYARNIAIAERNAPNQPNIIMCPLGVYNAPSD